MLGATNTHKMFANSLSASKPISGFSPKQSQNNLKTDVRHPDQTGLVGPTLLAGRKIGSTDKQTNGNGFIAGLSKKELAVNGLAPAQNTSSIGKGASNGLVG